MSDISPNESMKLAAYLVEVMAKCDEVFAVKPDQEFARGLAGTLGFRSGLVAGYRVNLDKRADRLAECQKNLAETGYPEDFITRLAAVEDQDFGAIGCGKSHIKALVEFFIHSKSSYCMILEDDFDFLRPAADLVDCLNRMQEADLEWDVLMLTGNDVILREAPKNLPFLLRIFEAQSAAGYIVNRSYIPTLLDCFIDTIHLLEGLRRSDERKLVTSRLAIDMAWKRLQRQDRWYIFNPTIGHQRPGFSDIEGMDKDYRGGTFYHAL